MASASYGKTLEKVFFSNFWCPSIQFAVDISFIHVHDFYYIID